MTAVCAGEQRAYQALVDRYFDAIARYSFRLLGNRAEVEDIAQETFLRMWTQANRWEPNKAKLTTWLHRIAHNLCVDHLRKHSRVELRGDQGDNVEQGLSNLAGEQDTARVENESIASLNRAIRQLPENQRSALALCHYQSFSNKEAADIMGLSVRALESLLSRAKRSLRKALSPPLETRG